MWSHTPNEYEHIVINFSFEESFNMHKYGIFAYMYMQFLWNAAKYGKHV